MNKCIFILITLFITMPVHAQKAVSNGVGLVNNVDLANDVMMGIYQNIMSVKDEYEGLEGFGEYTISENQYGTKTILYKNAGYTKRGYQPYEFGLTVLGYGQKNFLAGNGPSFEYGYSILGIKFAGYQISYMDREDFDIMTAIKRVGQRFSDEQFKEMPFRLEVIPAKKEFKVGEDIEFSIVLTSQSRHYLKINSVSFDSVKLDHNAKSWEIKTMSSASQKITLKPFASVETKFVGEGFEEPFELEIYVTYMQTFKGVHPTRFTKISIVP